MAGLAGKHVVFTGACGLIGSNISRALVENGAKLSMVDVNLDRSGALLKELQQNQSNSACLAPKCDLEDPDSVDQMLDICEQTFGPVDVLIHAAYPRTADWHLKFEDIPAASWKKNVDMHLNGTFVICQRVGNRFVKANRGGNIVLFSSIYGLVGPDFNVYNGLDQMTMPAAYSAIKGGMTNFVRYLASYLGPKGVRVNAICPGGVFSEQPASFVEAYCNRVPARRMAKPEDIVGPTLFLASDLSTYVSGINLPVDGGWTAI